MSDQEILQLQKRVSEMEAFIDDIILNAPQTEPSKQLEPRHSAQAWAFWVAGERARALKKWLDDGEGKTS